MTDIEPNEQQRQLIENTEGLYLVDAGAGTGKTFAVTRRYANIVDQPEVDPDDVLLVTFTRSAALEMKERIVDRSGYSLRELADAPISTFHAHCHAILDEHGFRAPTHLGIDDHITGSTNILEDELIEAELFREFLGQFRDAHPGYADQFRAIDDHSELLGLVKQLSAKGIFPTADGWYRDGESHLDGDFEAFRTLFDEVNQPQNGGRKQSELRSDLSRYGGNKTYRPDAPSKADLRGGRGTKQLDDDVARRVFEADREHLKQFVHDVFFEYLEFALGRNFLNFGFLQLFAFVLLCENHGIRERIAYEYVMIDEFQDTNEIQFKLALLLAGTDNLCVVGDWKQSIYSFQYADVANITDFKQRLDRFRAELNDDAQRVAFDATEVTRIELEENYRSTASILEFSEEALVTPASDGEDIDHSVLDDVVSLSSNASFDETNIEAVQHEDEHEAVLSNIQRIVGNEGYPIEDEDGDPRPPKYGDIAVFTRTRDYGRELLQVAEEFAFPMSYDGGVKLFRTDQAKLLLAWLRILESDADRGWAVVLERAGYTLDEIQELLVARRVFARYGFDGDYADVILHTIQSVYDATTMTRGDLIQFIEGAIEDGATHEVHTSAGDDSVTVQTIHAAKGLEYPNVILANLNDGRFPPSSRNSDIVRYEEPVGLRQRKEYAEIDAHPHVYDNWRHDVLRHCLPEGYDGERRLLYVAITRAESHVIFAGGEERNTFLEELPVEVQPVQPDVEPVERDQTVQAQLPFSVQPPAGPIGLTPHDLIDDSIFDVDTGETVASEGGGTSFGDQVHQFAEEYASGEEVAPSNHHEKRVKAFIDSLEGELMVEQPARLPLEVDGGRVTISGVVDLVHLTNGRVEVIDYKTDATRRGHEEYRKQLSVYHHVLTSVYENRDIFPGIYYTADDELVTLDPIPLNSLEDLVSEARG
ncbi:ATP-dependent DNA helicase [Halobacteriales archaeon QS_1_69_70]|nr:MAG: ATP-dependent DNA helicase [Halobacteriales archaeon QS_1_69_70]